MPPELELAVEVLRAKYQKLTWAIRNAPAGHSETKSKDSQLGFSCGPKLYILKPFFLYPRAISGRHFFGEIIYSSALGLKSATVSLIYGPPRTTGRNCPVLDPAASWIWIWLRCCFGSCFKNFLLGPQSRGSSEAGVV
jgi:hypothetical protein